MTGAGAETVHRTRPIHRAHISLSLVSPRAQTTFSKAAPRLELVCFTVASLSPPTSRCRMNRVLINHHVRESIPQVEPLRNDSNERMIERTHMRRKRRDDPVFRHQRLRNEIAEATSGLRAFRFALPAVVYLVENHIRFLVLKSLASPVTWVVFSHVEIPIVALMSYAFPSRPLTRAQWIAILLLLDGVMASEISLCHARENRSCDSLADYPLAALALVLLGALLAALAGISVEYMYKEEYHTSIHLQNTQLYAFGVVANAAAGHTPGGPLLTPRIIHSTSGRGFDRDVRARGCACV